MNMKMGVSKPNACTATPAFIYVCIREDVRSNRPTLVYLPLWSKNEFQCGILAKTSPKSLEQGIAPAEQEMEKK